MGNIEVDWEEDTCNNEVAALLGFSVVFWGGGGGERGIALSVGAQILYDLCE